MPRTSKPTGHTAAARKSPCYSFEPRGETGMGNHHGTCFAGKMAHKFMLLLLLSALSLTCVSPAAAQKKKKPEPPASTDISTTLVPFPPHPQPIYTLP